MNEKQEMIASLTDDNNGFNSLLGIRIEEFGVGHCICSLEISDKHKNPLGTIHGGVICTMLDTVAGKSGMRKAGELRRVVTQTGDIHFIKAITGGKIIAEGTLIKDGKHTAVATAELRDEKGGLVAYGVFDLFYTDEGNGIDITKGMFKEIE